MVSPGSTPAPPQAPAALPTRGASTGVVPRASPPIAISRPRRLIRVDGFGVSGESVHGSAPGCRLASPLESSDRCISSPKSCCPLVGCALELACYPGDRAVHTRETRISESYALTAPTPAANLPSAIIDKAY